MPLLSSFGLAGTPNFLGGGGAALETFTKTYNYTGGSQTFNAPGEIENMIAYVFGPGGGGEGNENTSGGAGGWAKGTINNAANTTFKIIVGGAGGPGTQENGSGGGYSGVFTNSWNGSSRGTDHNAAIIMSGGGGGSAGNSNGRSHGGGAGGGSNGQNGYSPSGGRGGSQNGGGNYNRGGGGGNCNGQCPGTQLSGGNGCGGQEGPWAVGWPCQIYGGNWCSAAGRNGCNAGGGGAGYYGGSGGGGGPNSSNGAGGSGYVGGHPNHPLTSTQWEGGNSRDVNPNATGSGYWPGNAVSRGGITGNNWGNGHAYGGHGKIVIQYDAYNPV